MSSAEARTAFISFFESQGHKFWRSSPVVPYNDPTLLFVNAGMCQYKPIFLGDADLNTEFGQMKRACNTQKCIRAGGKHNDLEDVGKDVYHHTFFEMLGNWSFGDYFKELAVEFAWNCLTQVYNLEPARLYATYFGGDEKAGLQPDLEARDYWLKYLPESHVLPGSMKENFWEMGETGPCGPCSELHYDRIGGRECPELVNQDDPDVLEIWNLVFMQYNRENSGKLSPLPHPCVDTGMGLERLVSVLNDLRSNYDTDLFTSLFKKIHELCPDAPREYTGKVGSEDPERIDLAYRAIADHIRTLSIAIADGAIPSNDGRGYVLRRILRRAVRYGRQVLNAPKTGTWFSQLAGTVIESLGEAFPELREKSEKIVEVISCEEQQFNRTLDRGTALFKKAIKNLKPGDMVTGVVSFELFATYGFPVDLTEVMCEEQRLKLDLEGFEKAMEAHHLASDGGNAKKLVQHLTPEQIHRLKTEFDVEPTDDSHKYVWDADHGKGEPMEVEVKAIFDGHDFAPSCKSSAGGELFVVFDRTCFYAESGGQVGDKGYATGDGIDLVVEDTRKVGGYVLHLGRLNDGELKVGDKLTLVNDFERRGEIAKNHTGTHVLNCALRSILGEDCNQAGSIVEPKKLRFDFTSQKALTQEQISELEGTVRRIIHDEHDVDVAEVPLVQAQGIRGVRCMFGENYPDPVRVVSVGAKIPDLVSGAASGEGDVTVEFCGGTHLNNSRAIEEFVVISEESIARGIRRVVAVTGPTAHSAVADGADLSTRVHALVSKGAEHASRNDISAMKDYVNSRRENVGLLVRKECVDLLDKLTQEKAKLTKILAKQRKELAVLKADECVQMLIAGQYRWSVIVEDSLGGDVKAMEEFTNRFQDTLAVPLILLSTEPETQTPAVMATVPKSNPLNAAEWLQKAADGMTCKSGGKPATARGTISAGYDQTKWTRQAFDYASNNTQAAKHTDTQ
ncbi:alanyl-tRNA synthetase [Gregarina niphandrodes]|uniref:Alanine--tRNA ligase n=1 Tax=Gregarina niphandrodes TaxID=110365 RepID=A0A023B1N0_GRENI|nr:alanyl-tRNA synthetase [Gregarina niphandrodes]EZG48580.1 alanyl-tRNA synthetase [Gregarina niphandrodes]|eukprot:XP_011132084.1 alanyl-tRNA synthetase [Gregarina niphandrodes]